MARRKHPKLNDLVRRGVNADDLDEMQYEEEQHEGHVRKKEATCQFTRIVVTPAMSGMKSDPTKDQKFRRRHAERAAKRTAQEPKVGRSRPGSV